MKTKGTNLFFIILLFLFVEGYVEDGATAAHYAAYYGNKQAASGLMPLDLSIRSAGYVHGNTALDLAILNNGVGFIDVLKGALADIAEEDFTQSTSTMEKRDRTISVLVNKRNAENANATCSADIVNQMAAGVDQTCIHVQNIEAYIDLVMGMVPLHIYYENQADYSEIFKNFDVDLIAAKGHANIWRNGDSIVKGISRTIELSREFEPEFRRKYKVNKERVQNIKNNSDQVKIIEEIEGDIVILEERKVNTTKMLKHAQMDLIKKFLRAEISKMENDINTKKKSLSEDFVIIRELEELAAFLEFVRADSTKIQNIALKTKGKLETFRDDLENDKSAFERHGCIAKETYDKLEYEALAANQTLAENKKKIMKLEEQIAKEKRDIEAKYKLIEGNFQKINKKRREILDKMRETNIFGGIMNIVGAVVSIFSPSVGGVIIAAGKAIFPKDGNSLQMLEIMADDNAKQARVIQGIINQKSDEISRRHKQIRENSDISETLRNDLNDFSSLDGDLKNLSAKTEKIVEAVSKALIGVNSIKGIFDVVTQKLGEMIDFAKEAKTEAEKRNALFFIYNELDILECNWNNVYIKVGTLDECTKYYGTNYL